MATWNASSSSRSATPRGPKNRRYRRQVRACSARGGGCCWGSCTISSASPGRRDLEHARHRGGEARPVVVRTLQLFLAGGREAVELGAPVVLRDAPVGGDEPRLLELVQRGIQRPFLDTQDVIGALL